MDGLPNFLSPLPRAPVQLHPKKDSSDNTRHPTDTQADETPAVDYNDIHHHLPALEDSHA